MDLIEIDGSYGEGGGQILRSAIAVSAITGRGVKIRNIRKNRPRPGLGIQHIKSIELAARLTGARVEGLAPGSTAITFMPGPIRGGEYSLDLGTAGSISLVLQSVTPIAAFAPSTVTFHITGGTDVRWSPTIDYFQNVTLPALRLFGFKGDLQLESRGFYPLGGGKVTASIEPARLHGIRADVPQPPSVRGISACSRLPPHVAKRQADAAKKYLEGMGIEVAEITPGRAKGPVDRLEHHAVQRLPGRQRAGRAGACPPKRSARKRRRSSPTRSSRARPSTRSCATS